MILLMKCLTRKLSIAAADDTTMSHTNAQPQIVVRLSDPAIGRMLQLVLMSFIFCCSTSAAVSAPPSDSACAPSTQYCGHLGDLAYPFGKKGSQCGASPDFQLSNCSQSPTSVYWDEFPGHPAVLDINVSSPSAFLTLAWTNSTPSLQPCEIFSAEQLPLLLPNSGSDESGIDLRASTKFSAFSLSPNNIFLLFNCTDLSHVNSSNYVQASSKTCMFFKNQCPHVSFEHPCIQFQPQWQLDLPKAMKLSQCSQFQFLYTEDPSLPLNLWKPQVIQLTWAPEDFNFQSGLSCRLCEHSNGTCGYDSDGKFLCFCPNNQTSRESCNTLTGNESRAAKIFKILGITAAVMTVLVAVVIIGLWRYSAKRRIFSTRSASSWSNCGDHWLQRDRLLSCSLSGISAREYLYHEILEATLSFADENIIGDGGFGSVYRGTLKDGSLIAVKRLFQSTIGRTNHFYNEIRILSILNHPNLVQFYGFCCKDERNLLLVFEYLPNGSVFDQLHHEDTPMQGASPFGIPSWRVRLRLAMETAEALSYLHNTMNPPVLHRDVKTNNILLDENFNAKLADFGLSRLVPLETTHVSTAPQGTPGYLDPEYQCCYRLTDKSDVYSFGVVLMELVSSEKAVDFSRSEKEINLSSMALSRKQRGSWNELIDTRCWQTEADANADVVVKELVQLAFRCLQPERSDRPSMHDVSAILTELWQRYACLPSCN